MTATAAPAPVQPRVPARQAAVWLGAALAAGAAAATGSAPFIILSVVLLIACAVGVLHSPLIFLWILTAISGIGLGWTDTAALDVAGRRINVNGLRWALVIATMLVALIRLRGAAVQRELRGWAAFVALTGLGVLWAPNGFEAFKQFLLYGAPLLTAVLVLRVVRSREHITTLRTALYAAAVLGAVVGLVPALAGDVLGGSFDPGGRLLHRSFGTFLLPVMALCLARLRYGDVRQVLGVMLLFALALATESRNTLVAMIALPVFTMIGTPWRWRAAAAGMLLLFVGAAYTYEPVRERIFSDERRGFTSTVEVRGTNESAQLEVAGIQMSGRGLVWLQTWAHAMRAPWLGHGTGGATHFLVHSSMHEIAAHPHNEYLRVFHDFGVVGVAVLLWAFAGVLLALRRVKRMATSLLTRELALAAILCWAAVALVSIVDNPLIYYFFFTHNVYLLTALALRSAELDAGEAGVAA